MNTIDGLLRKLKGAVAGDEEPASSETPFQWEPEPVEPAPPGTPPRLEAFGAADPEPAPIASAAPPPAAALPLAGASSIFGAEIPADVRDLGTVYDAAGVHTPGHGYGVDRVAGMLEHTSLAGFDKAVRAQAVLAALDAARVDLHDVVRDGLLRYRTLLAFEATKDLEFLATRRRSERRVEQLRAALAAHEQRGQAEVERLTREATVAIASLSRLKSRQQVEEERFYRTLSSFIEPLPARVLPLRQGPEEPRKVEDAAPEAGAGPTLVLVALAGEAARPSEAPEEAPAPKASVAATSSGVAPGTLAGAPPGRVASGVPGLDEIVGGGFPLHRTVLLHGDIGTGKTTFGLQFLMAGVRQGEAGVLVSVDEKPQHLIEDARRFGWDLAAAGDRGLLTLLEASPYFTALRGKQELDARQIASDLTQQIRRVNARRLVVDGATSLVPGAAAAAVEDFLRSLIASLEDNLGCTTLLTARTLAGAHTLAGRSRAPNGSPRA